MAYGPNVVAYWAQRGPEPYRDGHGTEGEHPDGSSRQHVVQRGVAQRSPEPQQGGPEMRSRRSENGEGMSSRQVQEQNMPVSCDLRQIQSHLLASEGGDRSSI